MIIPPWPLVTAEAIRLATFGSVTVMSPRACSTMAPLIACCDPETVTSLPNVIDRPAISTRPPGAAPPVAFASNRAVVVTAPCGARMLIAPPRALAAVPFAFTPFPPMVTAPLFVPRRILPPPPSQEASRRAPLATVSPSVVSRSNPCRPLSAGQRPWMTCCPVTRTLRAFKTNCPSSTKRLPCDTSTARLPQSIVEPATTTTSCLTTHGSARSGQRLTHEVVVFPPAHTRVLTCVTRPMARIATAWRALRPRRPTTSALLRSPRK